MTKKNIRTLIVGSSARPGRYAYLAAEMLNEYGYDFVPLGISTGQVFGKEILDITNRPKIENIDTITMYIGAQRQEEYIDYLLSLNPRRIIFNPGSENSHFSAEAIKAGILVEQACTLVLLRTKQY